MTLAHKTKMSVLATLAALVASLLFPLAPASADPGAFELQGTAHLSAGIGNPTTPDAPGCLGGVAVGTHGADPADPTMVPNAFAGFTYNNPDTVAGDATGNLKVHTLGGVVEESFDWTRVGATAVVLFTGQKSGHTGVAVAAFAPAEPPLFSCNGKSTKNYNHQDPNGLDAHALVVGKGVLN